MVMEKNNSFVEEEEQEVEAYQNWDIGTAAGYIDEPSAPESVGWIKSEPFLLHSFSFPLCQVENVCQVCPALSYPQESC